MIILQLKARQVEVEVVNDHCEKMVREKETNLNGDPTIKTRACTNNSEGVTESQEMRVRTVGMDKKHRQGDGE
jgi:hypothetical protein